MPCSGFDVSAFSNGCLLDLSAIDANRLTEANDDFSFIGAALFDGTPGQLRAVNSGGTWRIEADVDGDRIADLVLAATTDSSFVFSQYDFWQ